MKNSPHMVREFNEHLERQAHRNINGNDVLKYLNDDSRLVIVGLGGPPGPRRIGVWAFIVIAEHTFYDPTIKAKSDLWELIMLLWNDLAWAISVVPTQHQDKLARVAKRCGLRFSHGIPQVWTDPKFPNVVCQGNARRLIVPNAEALFPLDSRNVRTLEYIDQPKFTEKEEADLIRLWLDEARDKSLSNWWPDVIGG